MDWFERLLFVAMVAVSVALAWVGIAVVRADGRVSYCFVDQESNKHGMFLLVGHRDWRLDADLGAYQTLRDATDAAKAHGCTLGVK